MLGIHRLLDREDEFDDDRDAAAEPRSAREEFVAAAVDYLLGRPAKLSASKGDPNAEPDDDTGRPEVRRTTIRGGAGKREPERPSASSLGIRLVAELTGRSHAAPLFHFPDRTTLVAAVAAEGFRRQTRRVRAVLRKTDYGTGSAQLQQCVLAYVQWASDAPALFATMYDPELAPVLEAFMLYGPNFEAVREHAPSYFGGDIKQAHRRFQAYHELYEAKRTALEVFVAQSDKGMRDGSLRQDVSEHDLAHAVTSLADGLAWQRVTERQFVGPMLEAHTRKMVRLCFEGLGERGSV